MMDTREMNVKELNMMDLENAAGGSISYVNMRMLFNEDCLSKEAQAAYWKEFLTKNKNSMSPSLNLKVALARHHAIDNSILSENEITRIAIEIFGREALGL